MGCGFYIKQKKRDWLTTLLETDFFGPCFDHQNLRKMCFASIVELGFANTTYKINGEKAVHLSPRPQAKDAKPSTKSKTGAACEVCGRYLQDPPNRFCSIACKVSAVDLKPKDQSDKLEFPVQEFPHHLSWKDNQNSEEKQSSFSSTDVSEETKMWVSTSLKPRKGMNKRKGIPHRSPFS
ncbi:hypothetical protein V6N13_029608 [Hibiscus sabdariffa]|uniref:Uncharacterized protein n=2 Tax=Hibiscus sabdariffa TaxID=183260 RepID=A0ABR2A6L6_9ROSI